MRSGNLHGEVGYRWGAIELQGNFYWFNSDTRVNSFLKVAGGLNYYIRGHTAKIQTELVSMFANETLPDTRQNPSTPALHQIPVQAEVAF